MPAGVNPQTLSPKPARLQTLGVMPVLPSWPPGPMRTGCRDMGPAQEMIVARFRGSELPSLHAWASMCVCRGVGLEKNDEY